MYIRIVYTEIKSLDYKRMQLINIKLFHYNWNDNLLSITKGISGFYYQIVQQIKSRIWEMKEGSYTKTLTMFQVSTIFHTRDIRRNVVPKFIELCMEKPCWFSLQGHQHGGRNQQEQLHSSFATKA